MGRASTVVDPSRTGIYWLLMIAVLGVMLWPVLSVTYPTMVDYPSHLARVEILREWNHEPVLQQRYEIVPLPFPNLALELLSIYVLGWLSVLATGKVLLVLLIACFWAGCHFLGLMAGGGRPVWTAPIASLLIYNSTFLFGFINYNFGVASFLLALSVWLWHRQKGSALSLIAATAATTATYLAHLMGIGLLFVSMTFLTAIEFRRTAPSFRKLAFDFLPLIPSALLYLRLGSQRGNTTSVVWGPLSLKVRHLLVCLTTYSATLTVFYSCCCLLALAIVVFKATRRTGSNLFALGAFLLLLALAFPAQQLFSGTDADARTLIPAIAVCLLALPVTLPSLWARTAFVLTLGALSFRVVEIGHFWRSGDALTRTQVAILRPLPRGARVFPIFWLPLDIEQAKRERHIWHAMEYATVEKLAFFPQLINVVGQQPVMLRDDSFQTIALDTPPEAIPWEDVVRGYDFIYSYGVHGPLEQYLDAHYVVVSHSGKGTLYKLPGRESIAPSATPAGLGPPKSVR